MTPELWQRLKPLYNAALDAPEESRTGLLDDLCAGDAELARALHALLHADRHAGRTLDSLLDSPFDPLALLLPAAAPVLQTGTLLAKRFRILCHLGSGGMGEVYEACDMALDQGRIALKTIRASIARNPAALARFKDEVWLARQVSGPNVCRIHELYLPAAGDTGPAFLTMELLEGTTLHEQIAAEGGLPIPQAKAIAVQLGTALGCIHAAGIVHGDLKPRNVMLVPGAAGERVVVMDFGLARAAVRAARGAEGDAAEQAPVIAGTPSYMAPEQFEGGEVGPAADIYAFGLILYEMVTGVQPYAAHTPLAAAIRRSKPPQHASAMRKGLPAAWDEVISRCLQVEPARRYASAVEVGAALEHPSHVVLRLGARQRLRLHRSVVALAALLVLALGCFAVWWHLLRPPHRELTPDTAHWYALGMEALREGSYLKATRLLSMVTERDPTYALAHAALADAWTELDFTGNAQREMLLASSPTAQRNLNDNERRYIDAIRATLVRDYSAAAQDYEAILQGLPKDGRAQGYVNLGRIYEKAGRFHSTVEAYEKAAALNPDDPAPFLHLGILRSRLRDRMAAERAFATAERLYAAESDLEGLAEVAYQRGYAAVDAEALDEARRQIGRSLSLSAQIPSPQMEVRSLSQLSSAAYLSGKDDEAIRLAHEEMQRARDNGLEFWVTDALVREGNALLDKEQYGAAEVPLEEALARAQSNGHPRLEASATLTLASLRFQQGRWAEDIQLARRCLRYFQDYGFVDSGDSALLLIARGERNLGNYTEALASGLQLLHHAEATHSAAPTLLAEELVGNVLLRLGRFPEASLHFAHALEQAGLLNQRNPYTEIALADVLWQLGRYGEARSRLDGLPPAALGRQDVASARAAVLARMLLSQGDARRAMGVIEAVWGQFPELRGAAQPNNRALLRTAVLSEVALGRTAAAEGDAARLRALDDGKADPWDHAQTQSTEAILALHAGDPKAALGHARAADTFFAEKGMPEAEALALLTAADAAQAAGSAAEAAAWRKKSVDILQPVLQSWGVPVARLYLARPDRQQMLYALRRLRAGNGDFLDAVTP